MSTLNEQLADQDPAAARHRRPLRQRAVTLPHTLPQCARNPDQHR